MHCASAAATVSGAVPPGRGAFHAFGRIKQRGHFRVKRESNAAMVRPSVRGRLPSSRTRHQAPGKLMGFMEGHARASASARSVATVQLSAAARERLGLQGCGRSTSAAISSEPSSVRRRTGLLASCRSNLWVIGRPLAVVNNDVKSPNTRPLSPDQLHGIGFSSAASTKNR